MTNEAKYRQPNDYKIVMLSDETFALRSGDSVASDCDINIDVECSANGVIFVDVETCWQGALGLPGNDALALPAASAVELRDALDDAIMDAEEYEKSLLRDKYPMVHPEDVAKRIEGWVAKLVDPNDTDLDKVKEDMRIAAEQVKGSVYQSQ